MVVDLSSCNQRIQDKLIALVEEAHDEYDSRLRGGSVQASSQGSSQKPLRNRNDDKASKKAVKVGRLKTKIGNQSLDSEVHPKSYS